MPPGWAARIRPRWITLGLGAAVLAVTVSAALLSRGVDATGQGARPTLTVEGDEAGVDLALTRAAEASRQVPHGGRLTVITFEGAGPRISETRVTREDGSVHLARDVERGGMEIGRVGDDAFLRSSDQLLRLGGVEALPSQLDRLRDKYRARLGARMELDTGPARVLHLTERSAGHRRENLYLDEHTGLIVRRETFAADGTPVRLVAFTELDAAPSPVELPSSDGIDVHHHTHVSADVEELRTSDRLVPDALPGGYELLAAARVESGTPAVHLVYGDGLYTVSLFQQDGRVAPDAVRGADELRTEQGGAVWRWPGSEPRRVVWTGGGRTFTVLTDAPTDELLDAISGLPVDPPPSTLDRLRRGITRASQWLRPGEGSE